MKKICFITTIPGTIKAFLLDTAKYMYNTGEWEVYMICDFDDEFKKSLPDYIRYCPVKMSRGVNLKGIKAIRQMVKIFRKEKFDIIQYSTPNASLYASVAGKIAKVKVRNYHLMGLRYLGASGVAKHILQTIEKITCNNSTSIECVSKSNLELSVKEGLFKKEDAVVIWNGSTGGVDLSRFDYSKRYKWRREIREKLDYEKDDFIFGFVGRITRDKGINELLKAFFMIDKDCKLLLIGNPEGVNTLDEEIYKKALKNPKIKFLDSVNDIERYYAAIDVLILPSYREGFGNVIIEAGAVGTPAIISNIPGPIDAVEKDKTALIVEVGNVNDLDLKMKRCVNDKEMVCNMSEYTPRFIRNHFNCKVLFEKINERKLKLVK